MGRRQQQELRKKAKPKTCQDKRTPGFSCGEDYPRIQIKNSYSCSVRAAKLSKENSFITKMRPARRISSSGPRVSTDVSFCAKSSLSPLRNEINPRCPFIQLPN